MAIGERSSDARCTMSSATARLEGAVSSTLPQDVMIVDDESISLLRD